VAALTEPPVHPRARALRLTYAFCAIWFMVLSAGVGLLSHDSATTILALAVFSVGFALGTLFNESTGLVTSSRPATKRHQTVMGALVVSVAGFIAASAWLAAADGFSGPAAIVSCVISVGCIGAMLFELLR
jgi:hypothetical protein